MKDAILSPQTDRLANEAPAHATAHGSSPATYAQHLGGDLKAGVTGMMDKCPRNIGSGSKKVCT